MDCVNCGAPLPPKRRRCSHCGTLNDTDLRAIHEHAQEGPPSEHICPRCNVNLHTVDLGMGGGLVIERCDKCLGIFFDPGEVEALLDRSVAHVYEVDFERMNILIEKEAMVDSWPVEYIKCPVCQTRMNRKSYGARSGVIVDKCKAHGVWLDGGELGKLLRWSKAGGRLHDEAGRAEQAREVERNRRLARRTKPGGLRHGADPDSVFKNDETSFLGLLGAIARLLTR